MTTQHNTTGKGLQQFGKELGDEEVLVGEWVDGTCRLSDIFKVALESVQQANSDWPYGYGPMGSSGFRVDELELCQWDLKIVRGSSLRDDSVESGHVQLIISLQYKEGS